jgi:SRSO17 transposase
MVCSGPSGASRAGCAQKPRATLVRGASRPVLGRSRWDADARRAVVRAYVVESLASPDAVLVVDETGGVLKPGKASCGVARQYTGAAGQITNGQIGGVAAYVPDRGHRLH